MSNIPNLATSAMPTLPALKPVLTGPWKLFKHAADKYAAQFKPFAVLALISILGSLPLMVLLGTLGFREKSQNMDFTPATGAAFAVTIVVAVVVGALAMCALYLRNESPVEERVSETWKKARPFFWKFIGTSILAGLVIVLFSLLLVIPGIIYAVYYTLVEYPVLFEGMGPRGALKRSKELVKGYWWPLVGRGAFLGLLYLILAVVFGLVGMVFERGELGSTIWQMLQNVLFAFLSPLAVIYEYSIYKELKAIKEISVQ